MTTHEEISKRAQEIWEREGRPEGRDKEHWLQAESELRQENGRTSESMSTGNSAETAVSSGMGSLKEENGRKRGVRRGR